MDIDFEHILQLRNSGNYSEALNILDIHIHELENTYIFATSIEYIPESISLLYAKCLGQKAIVYRYLGDFDKAKKLTLSAIPFAEQGNDKELVALLISDIGVFQFKIGNIKDAERNLKKSLRQLEALGSIEKATIVKINYACMLQHRGEFEQCLPLFKQALSYLEQKPESSDLGSLLTNIAYAYENLGKKELALLTYNRAGELLLRINAIPMYILTSLNLVSFYNEEEMFELSKSTLDSIEHYIPTDEISIERIDFLLHYTGYFIGIKQIENAVSILNQIDSIDQSIIEPETKIYVFMLWSKVCIANMELEKAKQFVISIEEELQQYDKPELEPHLYWTKGTIAYLEKDYELAVKYVYKGINECTFSKPGTKIYRELQKLLSEIYAMFEDKELLTRHKFDLTT
jgi:tetratricopeptide (TPR) repeat protein